MEGFTGGIRGSASPVDLFDGSDPADGPSPLGRGTRRAALSGGRRGQLDSHVTGDFDCAREAESAVVFLSSEDAQRFGRLRSVSVSLTAHPPQVPDPPQWAGRKNPASSAASRRVEPGFAVILCSPGRNVIVARPPMSLDVRSIVEIPFPVTVLTESPLCDGMQSEKGTIKSDPWAGITENRKAVFQRASY